VDDSIKTVPDIDCLQYRGTKDNPDIKIFVSQRIDLESKCVDNPLYIPVRCGAVYDTNENSNRLGDNTGDNISEKRLSYCELTVMYWAWKNIRADYYGLHHYRRYLSFADKNYPGEWQNQATIDSMSDANLEMLGLLDKEKLAKEISKFDMIVCSEYEHVRSTWPEEELTPTLYESLTKDWVYLFTVEGVVDLMLDTIDKYFPEYSKSAKEYMQGKYFRGFNIFIMKRELFNSLCEFEFGVLEKMEPLLNYEGANGTRKRTPAYIGEMLFSIWVYHQSKCKDIKWKEKQIAFINNSDAPKTMNVSENVIPICYTASLGTLPLVGVSIKSLLENSSKDKKYHIIVLLQDNQYILKFDTFEQNQQKSNIIEIANTYPNVTLSFYDPKDGLGIFDRHIYREEKDKTKYHAFMLPWILEDITKVIFLRPETIIKGDVSELYDIVSNDKPISAIKDVFVAGIIDGFDVIKRKHILEELKLMNSCSYVDTSVLVMNLQMLRCSYSKDELQKSIIDLENQKIVEINDIFNSLYEHDIDILPQEWNYMCTANAIAFLCKEHSNGDILDEYNSIRNYKIISYRQEPYPWETSHAINAYEFWFYARQTPFYEQLLECIAGNNPIKKKQSAARQIADILLPKGTKRREFLKLIMPRGSAQWKFCKKIYHKLYD